MDKKDLWKLSGRPEEQDWLRERLEVLTVREGIALEVALRKPPAQAKEAVNLLLNLDEYEVAGGIRSYEDLGLYYLEEHAARFLELRDYIDLDKLGRRYEEQHPGQFTEGCYVAYPPKELPNRYDGVNPPGPEYSWSLRLELASHAVPEGVRLALPDYNDIVDVRPGEIRMALDALGVQTIRECTLLEARCSLPGITGLEQSYEGRLDELIYDGQNLGFILQEQDQGRKDFLQIYLWALEYEHCTTLPAALEVVQNLDRYQIVRADSLEEYALSELGKPTGFVRQEVADCFELERYGRDLLQHRGYTLTEDGGAYIAKQRQQTQAPVRISLL